MGFEKKGSCALTSVIVKVNTVVKQLTVQMLPYQRAGWEEHKRENAAKWIETTSHLNEVKNTIRFKVYDIYRRKQCRDIVKKSPILDKNNFR